MVVLCSYEVVKDALVDHSEEFGGRPLIPITDQIMKGRGECCSFFFFSSAVFICYATFNCNTLVRGGGLISQKNESSQFHAWE